MTMHFTAARVNQHRASLLAEAASSRQARAARALPRRTRRTRRVRRWWEPLFASASRPAATVRPVPNPTG